MISYITTHIIEIVGLVAGISYVIGAIHTKWWCWPAGIVSIGMYAYSTFITGLYGEFGLQFIYLFLSIQGWIAWGNRNHTTAKSISKIGSKGLYKNLVSAIILSALFYFILNKLGGSMPFWDALTNGFSIVATWMVVRKHIENWLIWIPVDLILVWMMWYKGFPFYAVLYLVYTGFAAWGYFQWKKELGEA